MYSIEEIKELIQAVDDSSVGELEIRNDMKEKVTIRKESAMRPVAQQAVEPAPQPVAQPSPQPAETKKESAPEGSEEKNNESNYHEITSPMVGTFYRSPSPEAGAYVEKGATIKPNTIVCIVEAMKLMNELEAEVSGEIAEILVEDGELVEYGQPLFRVNPS
ncbi:acetyl-CoA carboxylase, biotin carboxyl carrier protein [Marinococcus halophilus]|uniref:Biotin carboxyl carrier protein of acetyl-CoA carboxylase n=1 Tax=Marinococcus halophilus TaxID=1371 RepID=A0A510Y3X8_MARHA|nr:acetyl-CoA carboxylase biotin carboxyl carrier protein [Marinococcus halophilus]OZT80061.1 acetyl-CoA carboxylase, biotin carboxyl carrier protein [Marinococcus halophilus]GEK58015.1 biotin carboxyl carrier protein of acetyl-CoA carboxylase [Marinococcus halophilus]